MSRIRTIKPSFFRHLDLFEAERASGLPLRVAFAGLWTVADREGRFRWRPRELVLDVLPFDGVDFGSVLDALAESGFIVKYEVDGKTFGHIPTFKEHQHVNVREPDSSIPSPDEAGARTCENIPAHGEREGEQEREGKEDSQERARAPEPSCRIEFDYQFWPEYPHHVGRPKALAAFIAARQKAPLTAILDGLARYKSDKPPDRQWLNPATFLNEERWNDEPAPVSHQPPSGGKDPPHDAIFRALAERAQTSDRRGGREADPASRMDDLGGGEGEVDRADGAVSAEAHSWP